MITRRTILLGLSAAALPVATFAAPQSALLGKIRVVTVGSRDVERFTTWYAALGFKKVESGRVPEALARSWGAPKSAARKYVILRAGTPDFFVRAVEVDDVPGYKAATTTGWNAFEFVVKDINATHEKIKASPFPIIAAPKSLGGKFASIWAMQARGPDEEVLYLTLDTGDPAKSSLPQAQSDIDRVFIAIVAGRDMSAMEQFYRDTFGLTQTVGFDMPVPNLARPLGLPDTHVFPLLLVRAGAPASNVELDGYPAHVPDRPRANGQLPPGNALVSFTVKNLDDIIAPFAGPAARGAGSVYGSHRTATVTGAAGELIELIEEV